VIIVDIVSAAPFEEVEPAGTHTRYVRMKEDEDEDEERNTGRWGSIET
jgi:hypothetical protein